jgi:melatonin receptor type 1B
MYLARTLFMIYAAFAICWIPYAIIMAADRYDTFPYEVHVMITTFAHLHPSFNWLVLYYTNTLFRKAFNSMVKMDRCLSLCSKKDLQVNECSVISTNTIAK